MKKKILLFTILAMILTLAACSEKPNADSANPSQEQNSQNQVNNTNSDSDKIQVADANSIIFDPQKIKLEALTKQDGSITLTLTGEPLEKLYESDQEMIFYWDLWALNNKQEEVIRASATANSIAPDTADGKWKLDMLTVTDDDTKLYGAPIVISGENVVSIIWTRPISEDKLSQITEFEARLAISQGGEKIQSDIISFGREVFKNVMK